MDGNKKGKILNHLTKDYHDSADGQKQSKKIFEADIKHILSNEDELQNILKDGGQLEHLIDDVTLFINLVKDYANGSYRKVPYKSISSVVIALIYILNPIDIIPDFIPVIGHIDDAMVVALCFKAVKKDLDNYKAWKQEQTGNAKDTAGVNDSNSDSNSASDSDGQTA